ncbi:MAG: [FeFe] hydrogenase, group A [archaeon]
MAEQPIIKIIVNNQVIDAIAGESLLEACKRNKIKIPHLCYHERLPAIGACRLCIVELEGAKGGGLVASCVTPVRDGMKVLTHTPKVLDARRTNLKLLLANHDLNCTTCKRNLNCKLQTYAAEFQIQENEYSGERRIEEPDNSNISIRRDNNKCVLCQRCIQMCGEVQTVHAIGLHKRGFNTRIAPPLHANMKESSCINCGQCVVVCPTGALTEHTDIQPAVDVLNDTKKIKIAQVAPSIRATLGECFGLPAGTPVTGKIVKALRMMGFNYVFDADFSADVTIVEEANEFIHRLKENRSMPMITTCCPGWIKFMEQYYYDQIAHLSSCKSPMSMLSSLVKHVWAPKQNIDPNDITMVAVMPCTAKKYECQRSEMTGDTDVVLTTVELAKLIKEMNIDFARIEDDMFDNPLGESTGAAAIFARSGGVMEAALRTAADWVEGKDLKNIEYTQVRGLETKKEATVTVAGIDLKICVVHTLSEARKIMDDIKAGKSPYHFI